MTPHTDISGDRVKEIIREFIDSSPLNTMEDGTGEPAWAHSGCVTG
jgi:hypothetical protein